MNKLRYSLEEIQAALLKPAPNDGKMRYAVTDTSELFRFIHAQKLNWGHIEFRCVDGDSGCTTNEIEFHFPPQLPSILTVAASHKIQHLKQAQHELKQLGENI